MAALVEAERADGAVRAALDAGNALDDEQARILAAFAKDQAALERRLAADRQRQLDALVTSAAPRPPPPPPTTISMAVDHGFATCGPPWVRRRPWQVGKLIDAYREHTELREFMMDQEAARARAKGKVRGMDGRCAMRASRM